MRNTYILVSYFKEKLCHFQPYAVIFTLSSTPILIRNWSMHPLFVICRIYTERQWKVTTDSRTLNAGAHLDLLDREMPSVQLSFLWCLSVYSGLTSLSAIFQSYHDGVWLRQEAQCSLLECCLIEVSCPRHLTWYHTQSHYPDTGSTSPSSTP